MIIKRFFAAAALAVVVGSAGFVQGAPTISLDLIRNGSGFPQLDSSGNFQWVLKATPGTLASGNPQGDSLAITGGITLGGSPLVAGSAAISGAGLPGDGTNDQNKFDRLIPGPVPVGFSYATGTAGINGDLPEGIIQGTLDTPVFGAGILDSFFIGAASDPLPVGTYDAIYFKTLGPTTDNNGATAGGVARLSTTATFSGLIAQSTGVGDSEQFPVTATFTYTALAGDANLDGAVNFQDVGIVSGNFNGNPRIWGTGDFNSDSVVNFQDVGVLSGNFGAMAPGALASSVAVPEPSSVFMLICGALGILAYRVKS